MNQPRPIPQLFDFTELEPLVEKQTEIPKESILRRCNGKVAERLLNLLKMMQFRYIGKSENGTLYIF